MSCCHKEIRRQAQREEHVMVAAQKRDHEEPPGRGIDRWRPVIRDRAMVSAWEGTGVHRLTKVLVQIACP